MRLPALAILLAACSPALPDAGLDAEALFGPEVPRDDALPPPTVIHMDGPEFVSVGTEITLVVSGGLPEEDVFLAVGPAEGEGPCRRWLGGYCLGVAPPVSLAGRQTVGDDGTTTFVLEAAPWEGAEWCFQAMIRRGFSGISTGFSETLCVDHCSVHDDDDDGICNEYDVCDGGRDDLDSDGDGLCDALDLCPGDDGVDSDGDGVCDALDACPGGDDAADLDSDGVCDHLDACPGDDASDADGDGVCDGLDACPGDDLADGDGDGVCDALDACPGDDLADADGDGVCDALDACPGDDLADADGDGICDGLDAPDDPYSWEGSMKDLSVAADGSMSLLYEDGDELYVSCFAADGTRIGGPVAVGEEGDVSNVAGIWRGRVSHHTLVMWRGYGGPVEELRYAHLAPDCTVNVYEGVLWDDDYTEFFDAAMDDSGRAVVTYSDGATWVAWLDTDGSILRSEEAFDIGATYGGHAAMNRSTGAGMVGGQIHSGNGIYYRRFDADFNWIDGDAVHMDTGNYHYWYDGYTMGINDRGDFVFLWRSSDVQMDAKFFDPAGSLVNTISWGTASGGTWDSFRQRHQEIPLRGDNFILGDAHYSPPVDLTYYEYTPGGALVSSDTTTYHRREGLSIRTDGAGTAWCVDDGDFEVRADFP